MKVIKNSSYFLILLSVALFSVASVSASVRVKSEIDTEEPQNRKSVVHVVSKGEGVSSILRSYNISLDRFLKANKQLNGTNLSLSLGQRLVIPKKDIGSASDAEINHQIRVYLSSLGIKGNEIDKVETTETRKNGVETRDESIVFSKIESTALKNRHDEIISPSQPSVENGVNVAVLIPLTQTEGLEDKDYVSFYKGAVLAMDSLKRLGISVNVDVYDTGKGLSVINGLLSNGSLRNKHLVIGPVYNEQFSVVAEYAKNRNIVLISPLAAVDVNYDFVYQLAPSSKTKYDKVKRYLAGKRVVFFSNGHQEEDVQFIDMVKSCTSDIHYLSYSKDMKEAQMIPYFEKDAQNVVVIASKKKGDIESLLSKIALLKATYYNYNISVLGSSEFAKMDDDKKNDFFRTDTHFVTSYHQDRQDEKCLNFETKYVDMFGEVPSLYSYRAYDTAMIFLMAISDFGIDFGSDLDNQPIKILNVNYRFKQDGDYGKSINQEWMLVNYKPNYTIVTK